MAQGGYTYIVTNRPFGVLYTGVTSDLAARIAAHRDGTGSTFAYKWNCTQLVLVEAHDRIEDAIAREKMLKSWRRVWKLRLIAQVNPDWDDLYDQIHG